MAPPAAVPPPATAARDDDERYFVMEGDPRQRRWRRTDPAIPATFRQELVDELMSARRGVQSAKRAKDAEVERAARGRIQDAKVALGERGTPWWQVPTDAQFGARTEATIRALLRHRGPDKTICPSDVARTIGGVGWRRRMQLVRDVATTLASQGVVEVRQKGKVVDAASARGPIRLALR